MTFRFASPWCLLLLLVPLLLAVWPLVLRRRGRPAALRYADLRLVQNLPTSWRQRLRPLLTTALRLFALGLVVLAAARPQTGEAREIVRGQGVDIALALDISGSMASLDFEPQNRLEAAKVVIGQFIKERPFDRLGLVVFASNAFNQSPPTVDHAVLQRLLDATRLSTDIGIQDGTAIGMGLANAANMLKDSTAKSRVIILLTDGVNNSGQIDPLTAADAARTLGLKVYTIGMGKPGRVAVPVTDAFGRQRISYQESQLDEEVLRRIAEKTGGLYFRAEDTAGLQKIYEEINNLEKSQVEIVNYSRYHELMGWVLAPAVLILLLEMVLRRTVFRSLP